MLSVKAPRTWMGEVLQKHRATIRILDCKPTREGLIHQLVEVNAPHEELDQIAKDIRSSPVAVKAHLIRTKRGRMLGAVLTKDSEICKTVMGLNCFCRTCLFAASEKTDGTLEWTLAFKGKRTLKELLRRLSVNGIEAQVSKLTSIIDRGSLTSRQEWIIEKAYGSGYFDYPRKVGLKELARQLDLSPSTLGEIIRRGERKIVQTHVRTMRKGEPSDLFAYR